MKTFFFVFFLNIFFLKEMNAKGASPTDIWSCTVVTNDKLVKTLSGAYCEASVVYPNSRNYYDTSLRYRGYITAVDTYGIDTVANIVNICVSARQARISLMATLEQLKKRGTCSTIKLSNY